MTGSHLGHWTKEALTSLLGLTATVMLAGDAWAAMDLGIAMDAVPAAMKEAAPRGNASLSFSGFTCDGGETSCRWDSGTGVDLLVSRVEGTTAYEIEAGWANGRRASNASSGTLFRALCGTIVAAVKPAWSKQQVGAMVARIALLKPATKDLETVQPAQGVVFYGSRSIPNHKDFPAEAFVQCGVHADLEK